MKDPASSGESFNRNPDCKLYSGSRKCRAESLKCNKKRWISSTSTERAPIIAHTNVYRDVGLVQNTANNPILSVSLRLNI